MGFKKGAAFGVGLALGCVLTEVVIAGGLFIVMVWLTGGGP